MTLRRNFAALACNVTCIEDTHPRAHKDLDANQAASPPSLVDAHGTVGAGGSMLAGILLGLSCGLPLRDAVGFSPAAGQAVLLGSGTDCAGAALSSDWIAGLDF